MMSRAHRSPIGEWAWTVDRWLLVAIGVLIVAGLVFSMARDRPRPSVCIFRPSTSSIGRPRRSCPRLP